MAQRNECLRLSTYFQRLTRVSCVGAKNRWGLPDRFDREGEAIKIRALDTGWSAANGGWACWPTLPRFYTQTPDAWHAIGGSDNGHDTHNDATQLAAPI